jgi:hypothetical protein
MQLLGWVSSCSLGQQVCVLGASAGAQIFGQKFPNITQLPEGSDEESLISLRKGQCAAAAVFFLRLSY